MRNKTVALLCSMLFATAANLLASEPAPAPLGPLPWKAEEGISWEKLMEAPQTFPAPEVEVEGVRSLTFEGPTFGGKPTRVFAFYGVPEGASPEKKVPAIVLVHGGGGTAFEKWVKLWNSRGYAAIAFDHCGNFPIGKTAAWQRNPQGGPGMSGAGEMDRPVQNQWMYHAVANTLLAHSLLRSFPEVDADKIGITGISWGGVIASTVAGIDPRLKFIAPVYGCGHLTEDFGDGTQFIGKNNPPELVAKWKERWDPLNYLPNAKAPMLWVTGTNDPAFTLRALQTSYRQPQGPRNLCVRVRMVHAHGGPGESPEEILTFAESIVGDGKPLARITAQELNGNEASIQFESPVPITKAELVYTKDNGKWQTRKWETQPATLEGNTVKATLPEGTTVFYFNLTDDRKQISSSEHHSFLE